jgi:hypothetical protein
MGVAVSDILSFPKVDFSHSSLLVIIYCQNEIIC